MQGIYNYIPDTNDVSRAGLLNLLRDADKFGKILSACGQHEIQYTEWTMNRYTYNYMGGAAVAQLIEALRYKPSGRGFDSRWCQWIFFHWHSPSGLNMALGSTQPLTEMSTKNISWGVKAAGAYGWQPYHLHMPIV
jgi:hypothetical protein